MLSTVNMPTKFWMMMACVCLARRIRLERHTHLDLIRARRHEMCAAKAPETPQLLHRRTADVYRQKVSSRCNALEHEDGRAGAADAIRGLIEAILLEPDGGQLKITLKGDLAGTLNAARDSKRSPETGDLKLQIKLVAGARNHRSWNRQATFLPPPWRWPGPSRRFAGRTRHPWRRRSESVCQGA
jgi:hypothetical protein